MKRTWGILSLAPVILLVGCSPTIHIDTAGQASASPSPVQQSVSLKTTCDLLFKDKTSNYLGDAADAVSAVANTTDGNLDATAKDKIRSSAAGLRSIADTAGDEIFPHLDKAASYMERLEDAIDGSGGSFNTADFKPAATEITNLCTPFYKR